MDNHFKTSGMLFHVWRSYKQSASDGLEIGKRLKDSDPSLFLNSD
jgi:hypothetical protein